MDEDAVLEALANVVWATADARRIVLDQSLSMADIHNAIARIEDHIITAIRQSSL
jgi:hypothetical protein